MALVYKDGRAGKFWVDFQMKMYGPFDSQEEAAEILRGFEEDEQREQQPEQSEV